MKATENGIELNKSEITALLAFAGEKTPFDIVHFAVPASTKKLAVSATDGHRACEVFAQNEEPLATVGEWAVARDFLEACRRVLAGKGEFCRLKVTKSGLTEAVVVDEESLKQKGTIGWPEGAASTQITIETIRKVTRIRRNLSGSWFAINASYLRDIALMSSACGGRPVTIYPPTDTTSPIFFEAEGYEAQWCGVVMPVVVETPGGRTAEDPEEGREKTELEKALEELHEVEDKHRVKVSLQVTEGEDNP